MPGTAAMSNNLSLLPNCTTQTHTSLAQPVQALLLSVQGRWVHKTQALTPGEFVCVLFGSSVRSDCAPLLSLVTNT